MWHKLIVVSMLWLLFSPLIGKGQITPENKDGDRTLSPYFFVVSDDPSLDQLPLKATSVMANIAGVIADVKVTQVYKNEGKRPIEAVYIFPASTRAAVYGMKMTIGQRTIIAQIKEKAEARKEYEKAKEEGKSASLLEQHRPNVFQMNVANILPGDEIKVELSYTELLVPEEGVYEFMYPTVVGPRYSNQSAETAPESERWVQNPYTHEGETPSYTYDITVNLSTGIPINEIASASHKVKVEYEGKALAVVKLDESERFGGNRDFILKYRLSGGQIESGLLLYEGGNENFFLLMLEPPKRVEVSQIPPREYIFILDVSGSMHGFPLDISKALMRDLISHLRPTDRFNCLLFSGGSTVMAERSVPATEENINMALKIIDYQRGGGGTELIPALQRAFALPSEEGVSRTIVLATDGYVSVEKEAFELIRKNLDKANVFAFGIGTGVNRFLIEGIARAGMGEAFVVTQPQEAKIQAERFRKYIESPLLTKIRVDFSGFDAYDVEPASIPDLFAERPVIIFGKWKGHRFGTIKIYGLTGQQTYGKQFDLSAVEQNPKNSALRYLWARHRIAILSDLNKLDPNDKRVKEVTELGLRYSLLTDYTSFVAVDSEVRLKDAKSTTIKQPLPLPQGVSDYAVGGGGIGSLYMRKGRMTSDLAVPLQYAPSAAKAEPRRPVRESVRSSLDQEEEEKPNVPTKRQGNIKLGRELKTIGEVDSAKISDAIKQHIKDLRGCFKDTCDNISYVEGKIILRIEIAPDGKVINVTIVSSQISDKPLHKCILDKIKTWKLPASGARTNITIEFPLVISCS